MWLNTVELELQLWSIIIEVRLQYERVSTTVVLGTASSGDGSSKSLEVLLVECLSTLAEALKNDEA